MAEAFPSIPNFEVLTKLGSGGMGHVYLAKHRGVYGFEKLLAVKVIRQERDRHDGVRAMFLDEARLVARLQHPTIAQVYDFGESEGSLYLVMEYVTGLSISDILIEGRRPPPLICTSMFAAICRGLHAAHETKDMLGNWLNVVHRDVTPSNLVLTFAGQMKILDFGIALMRHRSAPATSVGQIRGKPTYLSPEQIEGEPIDRRTDIYSLAIVLHELLTGQKLFSLDEFLGRPAAPNNWKEIAGRVVPPSRTSGPLPRGLDDIVMKGLAVDPALRYRDARAMAIDLEAILEHEGCESLEGFVERELATHRDLHELRTRAILTGQPVEELAPQIAVPGTLDDDNPMPEREEATEPHAELEPPPVTAPVDTPVLPARAGKRAALIGAILLAVLGVFLAVRQSEPEAEPPPLIAREPPQSIQTKTEPVEAPEVLRAEPIVLPEPEPDEVPAVPEIEKRAEPSRRRPKKPAPKKAAKKISKPVPEDGIMTEW